MDIQVVRLFDVLDVDSVREAPGVTPRSVIITAPDLRSVEMVLLNGYQVPEFVIYNTNQLIAQVPAEVFLQQITDVFVLSNQLTLTEKSLVEFTFGTRPKTVSGTLKLMQSFIRMLVRTPGTNIFNKRSGGGLMQRIGTNITGGKQSGAVADSVVAVNRTTQYMIETQTPMSNIPPAERLLSAKVVAAQADPSNGVLALSVDIVSHSGLRGMATLIR